MKEDVYSYSFKRTSGIETFEIPERENETYKIPRGIKMTPENFTSLSDQDILERLKVIFGVN